MDKIHVIVAVHNRINITRHFIKSLEAQSFKNIHLILIDDGSTDGTYEMVSGSSLNKTIIRGDGNLWWGGALHEAYLWLKRNDVDPEDFVLTANDDIKIDDKFIQNGIKILTNELNTFLTANGYDLNSGEHLDGTVFYNFVDGTSVLATHKHTANCASTRALFFRVKDFLKVGGFHPILLPHYGSDYEFTIRAWRKGYQILSDTELKYLVDKETTGYMNYIDLPAKDFTKKIFSKKSVFNPIYKITFIILACPLKYIPINLIFQIKRYFKNVVLYIKRHLAVKMKDK
jgi:GT2 family glycosyltransferase